MVYRGKRIFDLLFSLLALLFLFPLLLLIVLSVLLFSGWPIFFCQQRFGQKGKVYKIYKFRTMVKNADQQRQAIMDQYGLDSCFFNLDNDPRVTNLGRLLRRYNLDELPQFINVIKGDMSIVGPRPILVSAGDIIKSMLSQSLSVRPGMTGLYQIKVKSKNEQQEDIRGRIKMDKEYIENNSIWIDLKIIFKTVYIILYKQKF